MGEAGACLRLDHFTRLCRRRLTLRPLPTTRLRTTASAPRGRHRAQLARSPYQFAGGAHDFFLECVEKPSHAAPGPVLRNLVAGPRTDGTQVPSRASRRGTWGSHAGRNPRITPFSEWKAEGSLVKIAQFAVFLWSKLLTLGAFICGFSCRTASNNEEWTSRSPL
jgi:hypothetical protein